VARRIAFWFLALAPPLVLLSFLVPGIVSEYLFATLAGGFPVALIGLAAGRRRGGTPLGGWLLGLLVLLEGATVAMLLLRGRVADGPWIGGLPVAAVIQLVGLWLAPLVLVGLVYALTFDRYELRDEDLARLDRLGRDADGDGW